MAGIGIKLEHAVKKKPLAFYLYEAVQCASVSLAPMLLIIGEIWLSGHLLGFQNLNSSTQDLYSCSVLYIFIFGLLTTSPFNAVLSKILSDIIFEERYADIMPCFHLGLALNLCLSCLLGLPFCIHEYFTGGVALHYVFTGFCGYIALVLSFYAVIYLHVVKKYKSISFYYLIGMTAALFLSLFFVYVLQFAVSYSMLLGLVIGLLLIACLEYAKVRNIFTRNSNQYHGIVRSFIAYKDYIAANFFFVLGLYIHNFVFWTTDMHTIVANSFVCAGPYDMATYLAMLTNVSASAVFINRIEKNFSAPYKEYSEAVIGGRRADIQLTQNRLFRLLGENLIDMVRVQFCISVIAFLILMAILPELGFSGLVLSIYPLLAAGFFVLYIMYAEILFLYYFNDGKGAAITTLLFCLSTFVFSILSTQLPEIWYGLGLLLGAFVGWTVGFGRLQWVERNMDKHIFCRGTLLEKDKRPKPSGKVYSADKQSTCSETDQETQ